MKKDQKKIKGTTEHLLVNLDITPVVLNWANTGGALVQVLPQSP